ncbi:MAG: DUF4436 domain-containing protein [Actinomycetales bacterium]|nr:DUF4436 domain-containing protein [Actinomycetales bacterium]
MAKDQQGNGVIEHGPDEPAGHPLLDPHPRPISRRGWVYVAIALVVLASLMTVIFTLYNREGGITVDGAQLEQPRGIGVSVRPLDIDPGTNLARLQLTFSVLDPSLVTPTGELAVPIHIAVQDWEGQQEIRYNAGSVVARNDVTVPIDGQEANYPFDVYNTFIFISANAMEKQKDGTLTVKEQLPVLLSGDGRLYGWDTTMDFTGGGDIAAPNSITYSRAFSTQLFAIALLSMMLALAVVALVIALLVATGRRPMEVALLGWLGSILFSLPLLRNSLPNGPPIGATIDVLLFFWVLLAVLLSAVLVAITWSRQRREELFVRHRPRQP